MTKTRIDEATCSALLCSFLALTACKSNEVNQTNNIVIQDAGGADVNEGCAPGTADCNGNPADGCEVKLAGEDANNCGACGRSCQGASCVSGLCAPTAIAIGIANPSAIEVDATNVYFTTVSTAPSSSGTISSVPTAGGSAPMTVVSLTTPNASAAGAIALIGAEVAFFAGGSCSVAPGDGGAMTETCNGGVYTVPKQGGQATTLASSLPFIGGFAASSNEIVWADGDDAALGSMQPCKAAIHAIARDGSGQRVIAQGLAPIGRLTISPDEKDVFVATYTEGKGGCAALGVFRVALSGGTPMQIATLSGNVGGLTVDANAAYWTISGPNAALIKAPRAGGPSAALESGIASPDSVVSDGTNLYVSTLEPKTAASEIYRVNPTTGAATRIAGGFKGSLVLAVDGSSVYAAARDPSATLVRIPK